MLKKTRFQVSCGSSCWHGGCTASLLPSRLLATSGFPIILLKRVIVSFPGSGRVYSTIILKAVFVSLTRLQIIWDLLVSLLVSAHQEPCVWCWCVCVLLRWAPAWHSLMSGKPQYNGDTPFLVCFWTKLYKFRQLIKFSTIITLLSTNFIVYSTLFLNV